MKQTACIVTHQIKSSSWHIHERRVKKTQTEQVWRDTENDSLWPKQLMRRSIYMGSIYMGIVPCQDPSNSCSIS